MQGMIKAIILDWAGTAVDYGSFAPVDAFLKAFTKVGITPTMGEIRAHMGLPKREHIEKMLGCERLSMLWRAEHGRAFTQKDVDHIYSFFEPSLFGALASCADPLPGVPEAVMKIREMGIVIGSTTGYTQAMMDVVAPLAKRKGYSPDHLVCPDETGGIGRPYPYMLWRNLEKLGILSINEVVKVGDTAADMHEGNNAGCLCVGVVKGSSILGLREAELGEISKTEAGSLFEAAKRAYIEAGADFVIEDIAELPNLITALMQR